MVSEGFSTSRGRRGALVHRDEVRRRVRGRRGARMLALTSGGAIPEVADYRVLLEPDDTFIGTLNEDFAIESMAGDIFQLGQRVVAGAPGGHRRDSRCRRERRAAEHSRSGSAKRQRAATSCRAKSAICAREIDAARSPDAPSDSQRRGLQAETGAGVAAAEQAVAYLAETRARAWRRADAGDAGPRAILRRVRRHAARAARAVRQPHQQGVGARAPQAILPAVQLRAAGGRDRGRAAAVARAAALVSARRRLSLPASGDGEGRARPGVARCAGVSDAVALEHDRVAGGAAVPRRTEGAAAAPADAGGRPDGGGLSGRRRLPREHSRAIARFPIIRWSRRRFTTASGGDGLRGARAACSRDIHAGTPAARHARHARAVADCARDSQRAALRVSRRCAARGAADAGGLRAPRDGEPRPRPTISARWIRRRSRACARKRGRIRATPTSCTTRWSRPAFSQSRSARSVPRQFFDAADALRARMHARDSRRGSPPSVCRKSSPSIPAPSCGRRSSRRRRARRATWTRDDAIAELLRGRVAIVGPTTAGGACRVARDCRGRRRSRAARSRIAGHRAARPVQPAERRRSGATARCWRAFIATRSIAFAPKSSR